MLGITYNEQTKLREENYHFIENEDGDELEIKKGKKIIRRIKVNSSGLLDIMDPNGFIILTTKTIKITLSVVKGMYRCVLLAEKNS